MYQSSENLYHFNSKEIILQNNLQSRNSSPSQRLNISRKLWLLSVHFNIKNCLLFLKNIQQKIDLY